MQATRRGDISKTRKRWKWYMNNAAHCRKRYLWVPLLSDQHASPWIFVLYCARGVAVVKPSPGLFMGKWWSRWYLIDQLQAARLWIHELSSNLIQKSFAPGSRSIKTWLILTVVKLWRSHECAKDVPATVQNLGKHVCGIIIACSRHVLCNAS